MIGPYLHVVDRQSIRREQLVREYIHHKRRTIPDGWRTRRGAGTGRRGRAEGESAGSAISRIPPLPRRLLRAPPGLQTLPSARGDDAIHGVLSAASSRPRRVSLCHRREESTLTRSCLLAFSRGTVRKKRRPTSVGTPRASLPPSRLFCPLRALRFPRESARFLRDRGPRQGRRISLSILDRSRGRRREHSDKREEGRGSGARAKFARGNTSTAPRVVTSRGQTLGDLGGVANCDDPLCTAVEFGLAIAIRGDSRRQQQQQQQRQV